MCVIQNNNEKVHVPELAQVSPAAAAAQLSSVLWIFTVCSLSTFEEKKVLLYLKYKLFPSEDSDGVKVSLTDVWPVIWLAGVGRLRGPGRGRRTPGLGSCGQGVEREREK